MCFIRLTEECDEGGKERWATGATATETKQEEKRCTRSVRQRGEKHAKATAGRSQAEEGGKYERR